jgi:hypothetical protein
LGAIHLAVQVVTFDVADDLPMHVNLVQMILAIVQAITLRLVIFKDYVIRLSRHAIIRTQKINTTIQQHKSSSENFRNHDQKTQKYIY